MTSPHPTNGKCKRCGQELPRLSFPNPFAKDGEGAEHWCSDHCYNVELQMQSMKLCQNQRRASGLAGVQRQEETQ